MQVERSAKQKISFFVSNPETPPTFAAGNGCKSSGVLRAKLVVVGARRHRALAQRCVGLLALLRQNLLLLLLCATALALLGP